jgi:ribose 1,5-bisphosphokinase
MTAHLFYITGPSGSGKDSLLSYARSALAEDSRFCFAHRYITRPANAGGENHVALSAAEFKARQQARLFAMQWSSHGLQYGIGIEINQWLAKGVHVVINGSRTYLEQVRLNYPELIPVGIDVDIDILRNRLLARGRETPEQIEQRLARNLQFRHMVGNEIRICNNGAIEDAGQQLVQQLLQRAGNLACA